MQKLPAKSQTISLPPDILQAAIDAALAKRILKGRKESILARLEYLAAGLIDESAFFQTLFRTSRPPSRFSGKAYARELGERFWLESFTNAENRRMGGIFYTPVAVIDRILDLVWPTIGRGTTTKTGITLCDPAMGCGFFPLRVVERLMDKKPRGAGRLREWAAACLFGVDLDPAAVFMGKIGLWLALSDAEHEFIPDPAHFRVGDSLLGRPFGRDSATDPRELDWPSAFPEVAADGGFDCIVGNPPYEVLTNFSRHPQRRLLAERLRDSGHYHESLTGQINLYRCFIERSLDLLKPGGALSFVVPFSMARDVTALPLRRRLLKENAAEKWLLFSERERIFSGVTQSACIFAATKNGGAAKTLSIESGGKKGTVTIAAMARFTGDALIIQPMDKAKAELLTRIWDNCPGRLEDAADMRVGEVDQTFFRSCMTNEDTGTLLARGAHLSQFKLDLGADNTKERFLRLDMFLDKKGASAKACRERAAVWRIGQLGIRNMNTLPRLVAALIPPGVYLGNSLNVYTPRECLPLEYVAGILNSRLLDWLFRLASGNNNINLHEMRRLPFPLDPGVKKMGSMVSAYQTCAKVATEGGDIARYVEELNKTAEECYGVAGEIEAIVRQEDKTHSDD